MLNPKNNAAILRLAVLTNVAKSFLENNLSDIENIPVNLVPDDAKPARGSLEKDRNAVKQLCLAALGFTPCNVAADKSLSDSAKDFLARTELEKATVSVLPNVCDACKSTHYEVTSACHGCYARPCAVNCPKKTIIVAKKAVILQDNCIKCGLCAGNCPYNAINKALVPCEDACPVGAISKDENGVEHIDNDKCISCGKCIVSCPFGAIAHNSQLLDVLKALKNPQQKTVAMLAPAVIGQFGNDLGKVIAAFKKLGFDEVVEVAQGADITTKHEAAEFVERMHEGAKFMTTSCCPAWMQAMEKHMPELKEYVSTSGSPMYYIAEVMKKEFPEYKTVFVGPCMAKRLEAERNPNVDYVLIFEELQAAFDAAQINPAALEADKFAVESSAQGRRFPISGGVAGAVQFVVGDKAEYKPLKIDGLTKDSCKMLKRFAAKAPEDANMIEVMCCEGGCIAGPGAVIPAKRGTVLVENYVKTSKDIEC